MTPEPDKAELERKLEAERAGRAQSAQAEPNADDADDEPENDDADDELEDEDEPEVEAVKESTPEQSAKELGRVMDSFELELRELFGSDEPLTPVPMDGALGFMVPGMLELVPNEKYKRCPTCNGHGQVLTGSLADGKQTADCPRCLGRGYLERLEATPTPPGAEPTGNGTVDDDAEFGVPAWMGNPNIGAQS